MENLIDKINQLIECASNKKEELSLTKRKIKHLEDACKFKDNMIEILEKELEEQYVRIAELEKEYVNAIFRIRDLVEEIEIKDVKIEELEEKFKNAKSKPEELDLQELEVLVEKLKSELDDE